MRLSFDGIKDKEWCINQYVAQQKSLRTIRKETGLGINTIKRWFRKYKVVTRQDDEVIRSQKSRPLNKNGRWKGKYNNCGYWYIYYPEHPNAPPSGYISESRFNAEILVGRILSIDERVHHIDMNKMNNHPENLFVCQNKGHRKTHASFNRLCKTLIERGIIFFDKNGGKYGCLV